MTESGNLPSIGLESPTLDERRKCEEARPERSHLSSALTLQLIFHFGRHFFNQHNWLCGVVFLFMAAQKQARAVDLCWFHHAASASHITLNWGMKGASSQPAPVQYFPLRVVPWEGKCIVRSCAGFSHPPLCPLRLSESVKEAGRHGYNQRCHVTLPCRHLSLSSFSGSVAFLLAGVKNVAFVLLCFTLIHM